MIESEKDSVAHDRVLAGYAREASSLTEAFEAISCETLYAPVRSYLPADRVNMLDIGAGTGRDAAWFAGQGHRVLAVEPVSEFRVAGLARHSSPSIHWLDDTLPALSNVLARDECFDFILLNAVWHHLEQTSRQTALGTLARLLKKGGFIVFSLRHGPGSASRPAFKVSPSELAASAAFFGIKKLFQTKAGSLQSGNRAVGVTWTWMVFQKV
ncbi:class I SAM-dependent methyltransferase [Sneathiella aquimaris]|uniref:class I SAM-dependent methyltransferase n=1 Tax=Sneathiella aquimaris TaxID=2599305 RepID=UPI00146E6D6B|nr:class I SAM-dependent methyltransferase [Sneathiella aquimaris]